MLIEDLRARGLQAINLNVAAGECVVVSGPSGAGKTLLLRAIADLDPREGEVYLDDVPSRRLSGPEWRRRVGFLPAESHWWMDTVGAHFPQVDESSFRALGFDLQVTGWSVSRLSSGERQRLALLRLLANQPDVLLLDEPTANLDPAATGRAEELLRRYRQQHRAAVLWVSHDPTQAARVGQRRIAIDDGRLGAEEGRR